MEAMQRQAELERQLANFQLELSKSKLLEKQKQLIIRQKIIEEHNVDVRDELAGYLNDCQPIVNQESNSEFIFSRPVEALQSNQPQQIGSIQNNES